MHLVELLTAFATFAVIAAIVAFMIAVRTLAIGTWMLRLMNQYQRHLRFFVFLNGFLLL